MSYAAAPVRVRDTREGGRARAFVESFRESSWINSTRVRVYPKILFATYIIVFVGWLVLRPGGFRATLHPVGGDFPKCWAASRLFFVGASAGGLEYGAVGGGGGGG